MCAVERHLWLVRLRSAVRQILTRPRRCLLGRASWCYNEEQREREPTTGKADQLTHQTAQPGSSLKTRAMPANAKFFMQLRSCRQRSRGGIERITSPPRAPCLVRRSDAGEMTLQTCWRMSSKPNKGITTASALWPASRSPGHLGHRRFLQLAVMVQPPQPDTFSSDIW